MTTTTLSEHYPMSRRSPLEHLEHMFIADDHMMTTGHIGTRVGGWTTIGGQEREVVARCLECEWMVCQCPCGWTGSAADAHGCDHVEVAA